MKIRGGLNVAKKKAKLGILDEISPPTLKCSFPTEGFSEELSALPEVSYGTIWRYMIETCDAKKQLSTAKPLVKGFNFFKSGHVLSIKCQKLNDLFYIKSQVLPSMKKITPYSCFIILDAFGQVVQAYDGCPAGVDGRCNHVAATLFALEGYFKHQTKESENVSCTSKPCTWNIPRKRKVDNLVISDCKFRKHQHGKAKVEKDFALKVQEETPIAHDYQMNTKISNYLHMIKETEIKTGKKIGLSMILPQNTVSELQYSVIHDHNYISTKASNNSGLSISPIKVHPPSLNKIQRKAEEIKHKLCMSKHEISELEKKTVGQSKIAEWNLHRQYRITASKCYRVACMKETTSPTKAVQEILHYKEAFQTTKMKEGLRREEEIIQEYKEEKKKSSRSTKNFGNPKART